MSTLSIGLLIVLIISLSVNVLLYIQFRKKKKPKDSEELSQFAKDLNSYGAGLLQVKRVDPSSIMIRSPRGL